jgi:hypothetical protein
MPSRVSVHPLKDLVREFQYDPATGKLTRRHNYFITSTGDVYVYWNKGRPVVTYLGKELNAITLVATLQLGRHVEATEIFFSPEYDGDLRWSAFRIPGPGRKICSKCLEDKADTEFRYTTPGHAKKGNRCKACMNGALKVHNRKTLPKKYGLPLGAYETMLAEQNGKCKICGLPEAENRNGVLCFDHCHTVGHVRGLLCNPCNSAIGLMMDDPRRLLEAAKYLLRKSPT